MEKKDKDDALMRRFINALSAIMNTKKRKESKTRNEFRLNLDANHPNFIFEEDKEKDEISSIGITHEPETFGVKNMPLTENPKKGKTEQAYIRNGVIQSSHKNFSRKTLKNMKFSSEDKPNVKSKIRNYKKNRKKKNKKKK